MQEDVEEIAVRMKRVPVIVKNKFLRISILIECTIGKCYD